MKKYLILMIGLVLQVNMAYSCEVTDARSIAREPASLMGRGDVFLSPASIDSERGILEFLFIIKQSASGDFDARMTVGKVVVSKECIPTLTTASGVTKLN